MKRYNPNEIEAKWQKEWADKKSYVVNDNDPGAKFYHLVEFPYPSGAGLHVGHSRPYITFDIMSRWRRMNGENVLFPIGWDSFGLPAEQYALKTGVHPSETTKTNIDNFRRQAQMIGLSFDWSREFATSDPKLYKWTQWIFLNLFKHGLAYQAESVVWWCEGLKSVLADEEVINGRSERGDFPCERRPLRQWMLAITKYADRLYDDLDNVDYIEPVKVQQRNWIGRSKGAEVDFNIENSNEVLTVFTTRPDTLFGATYMVLAPEHPLVERLTSTDQKIEVEDYVKQTSSKSELNRQEESKDKTGVFIGAYAINPVNGNKLPIWISDYVLMGYGTGAIMAVPAHDERDHEFATKFKLPIIRVVKNKDSDEEYTTSEGTMINSGEYNGMPSGEAREKLVKDLETKRAAKEITNYKLRDWVFSRQRYWGEPFPIVWVKQDIVENLGDEVTTWLPERSVVKKMNESEYIALPIIPKYLPVELPEVEDFTPKGLGKGPLAEAEEWVHVWYNLETGEAKPHSQTETSEQWVEGFRETDTMPNWAGSSWYFLRYLDPENNEALADLDKIKEWMPVNWYNGGMEHTTLHLLYSRFWHKFLYDLGVVNSSEPYTKRTSHGMILASDGRKMSKSWGNVVDPIEIINDYGADTLRLYMAFIGPFEQSVAWNVNGVAGCRRFIERFWTIAQEFLETEPAKPNSEVLNDPRLRTIIAQTNKKITHDIPRLGFNTAVAALMEAVNGLYKLREDLPFKEHSSDWYLTFKNLILLIAPFTPHLAEDLWSQFGFEGDVLKNAWPKIDESALEKDNKVIIIQVNGKLRGQIDVSKDLEENEIIELAKKEPKVKEHIENKTVQRSIYVKDKLVNFVIT